MIRLEAVSKTYRVAPGPGRKARIIEAVRAVTTTLEPGSITGVVGPNGAGKTTLFGLLLGFLEATTGTITVDGREPRAYVRSHGATYLPERFLLPRDWTVRAALQGLLALDKSHRSVDDVLRAYQLGEFAGARVHTLSRGTMQRLGIAQAFANPRRLVVLDEPTEGLDPLWRVRFREEVRALRSGDRVVLLASHDLVEVERIADRVLVLNDGTLTDDVDLQARRSEPGEYALQLASPHDAVLQIFTRAQDEGAGRYTLHVDSAAEMSVRLSAIIEAGATVVSLRPAADLEQRVRRAAQGDAGA